MPFCMGCLVNLKAMNAQRVVLGRLGSEEVDGVWDCSVSMYTLFFQCVCS